MHMSTTRSQHEPWNADETQCRDEGRVGYKCREQPKGVLRACEVQGYFVSWPVDPTSQSKSKFFFWDVDLGIQLRLANGGFLDGYVRGL